MTSSHVITWHGFPLTFSEDHPTLEGGRQKPRISRRHSLFHSNWQISVLISPAEILVRTALNKYLVSGTEFPYYSQCSKYLIQLNFRSHAARLRAISSCLRLPAFSCQLNLPDAPCLPQSPLPTGWQRQAWNWRSLALRSPPYGTSCSLAFQSHVHKQPTLLGFRVKSASSNQWTHIVFSAYHVTGTGPDPSEYGIKILKIRYTPPILQLWKQTGSLWGICPRAQHI